jgi:H+/Cl- antiporter ClcA
MVRNLPRAFLTATLSLFVLLALGVSSEAQLFLTPTLIPAAPLQSIEIVIFVIMGIICGVIGVLFVLVVQGIVSLRNAFLDNETNSSDVVNIRR